MFGLLSSCDSNSDKPGGKFDIPPADTSNIQLLQPGEAGGKLAASKRFSTNYFDEYVDVMVTDYVVSKTLPLGYPRDFWSTIEEKIDVDGNIQDGYSFAEVTFQITNNNDFDCLINLAKLEIASFADGDRSINVVWVKDRQMEELAPKGSTESAAELDAGKKYYMPLLSAGSSETYKLGYFSEDEMFYMSDVMVLLGFDRIGLDTKNIRAVDLTSFLKQ
jgi:hypothetical protein